MNHLRVLLLAVSALAGCAGRRVQPGPSVAGEARGLLTTGFETALFRACDALDAWPGERIGLPQAVAAQFADPWPPGAETRDHRGRGYHVYYVRAIVRRRPEQPPPAGWIRLSSAPASEIAELLEVRAPLPGECGWDPAEHMQRAP